MGFRCELCEQKYDSAPSMLEDRGDCVIVCHNCFNKRTGYGMRLWGERKKKNIPKHVLVDNRRNPSVMVGR